MRKLCFILFAFVFVLSATDNSKTAPIHYESPLDYTPGRGTMLFEGFESSVMPPAGWDTVMVSGGTHWAITAAVAYAHSDSFGALHPWGYSLDNWLRRPTLDFSANDSLLLKFWWKSSYYWHVDPYDNGDLFVEVSSDDGTSWDTLWTFGDSAMVVNSGGVWPWVSWDWYQATLNLSVYGGEANVMVAFHVVADDNADIVIDDIEIDTIMTSGLPIEKDFNVNIPSIVRDLIDIKFIRPAPENLKVRLFNVVGGCVESRDIRIGSMNSRISLKNMPAGIYLISIDGSKNYLKQKLTHLR